VQYIGKSLPQEAKMMRAAGEMHAREKDEELASRAELI